MAPTPLRNVRISDEIWQAAKDRADQNGDNLSDVIRRGLEDYVNGTDER
ncbi:hypothetical protein [Microbacterium sp. CFBP 8794]|nr:hypothetical protein [Microbacterium sp. CFBP 8794]MBD8477559.1 hypothetical protein [Microbacterium sp. CFBP 8794]